MGRLEELKTALADSAAQCDIESFCPWVMRNRHKWLDTNITHPDEKVIVETAVEYLTLRKKIERNRLEPNLVMVKPLPEAPKKGGK